MTKDEAIECAKNMTYQEAIRNTIYAKGVRYKKATRIKLHELAEIADKIDTAEPSGDLISRADAIKAICNAQCELDVSHYPQCDQVKYCDEIKALLALPSAEPSKSVKYKSNLLDTRQTDESCQDCPIYSADRQTVIRSKTLMPTKDFNEWAKRIREVNPNAVVIPCDAEVVSADRPMGEWIFNPKDAIELMFTKPKCSECGFESSDGGNYCPNCGARMKGGTE